MIPFSRVPFRPVACIGILLLASATLPSAAGIDPAATMRFAANMAREGNWREALYRWTQVLSVAPHNPRLLNNLAVAHEALGEAEEARSLYERAATLAPQDERIESNRARFHSFWRHMEDGADDTNDAALVRSGAPGRLRGSGKPTRVTVSIPTPPKLDASGMETLLVTSFLDDDSELMDTGVEMVRFLRSEYSKNTDKDVLNVTPAPAIPEQRLEDLKANREFWRHLGREYGADLIVSGIVEYDRRDYSGFRDVDRLSPATGQKVRTTRFVEQERFGFDVDILFIDGSSGEVLFHDHLRRSSVYQGSQNDPITAFYEIAESLKPDLLAAVKPRMQNDTRVIFRNG